MVNTKPLAIFAAVLIFLPVVSTFASANSDAPEFYEVEATPNPSIQSDENLTFHELVNTPAGVGHIFANKTTLWFGLDDSEDVEVLFTFPLQYNLSISVMDISQYDENDLTIVIKNNVSESALYFGRIAFSPDNNSGLELAWDIPMMIKFMPQTTHHWPRLASPYHYPGQYRHSDEIKIHQNENGSFHLLFTGYDNAHYLDQGGLWYGLLEPNNYLNNATNTTYQRFDWVVSPSNLKEFNPFTTFKEIDLVVDEQDKLHITYIEEKAADTEMVFIVDTSGSMYSEWSDLCTILYGGNFTSGGYYEGLKPYFSNYSVSLLETIYGLGDTAPSPASEGNCAAHNKNTGPRNTPLGLVENDTSGGIRTLSSTVYNGAVYTGDSGEDWGPGTNWACLSWKDSVGNVPGNPPTSADHKWNPNVGRIVLPLSDEGPKDGDPAQQADDVASIDEAHDNCLNAGVIPVGLPGMVYGATSNIESHMRDLAHCPNGVVSVQARNCPGNSVRATDAGGQVYEFPSGTGGASQMQLLIEALTWQAVNQGLLNSKSSSLKYMLIDPFNAIDNTVNFSIPHRFNSSDKGSSDDGHLIVVAPSSLDESGDIVYSDLSLTSGDLVSTSLLQDGSIIARAIDSSSANQFNGSNLSDSGISVSGKSVIQGSLNQSFESDDIGSFSVIYEDYFETLNVFYSNQNNQSIEVNHLRFELESNSFIIHENNSWSDYNNQHNWTDVGVIKSELDIMLRWFSDDCDNLSFDGIFEVCGVDLLSNNFGIEVSSDINFDSFNPNESRNVTVNITSLFPPQSTTDLFSISHNPQASWQEGCAEDWDVLFSNQSSNDRFTSLELSFNNSTKQGIDLQIISPQQSEYEELIDSKICIELTNTYNAVQTVVSTYAINISAIIDHSWYLEFEDSMYEVIKDELTAIEGIVHNNGTASDTFQLVVNSASNATCNGCVVAVSEPVTLSPNTSGAISIEVNLSSYDVAMIGLTVINLDDANASGCNSSTGIDWCLLEIIPKPNGSFMSISSEIEVSYLEGGDCIDVEIVISLSEIGFINALDISLTNTSNLVAIYNQTIDLSNEESAKETMITLCSLSSDSLVDVTNVVIEVDVQNYEEFSSTYELSIIPYSRATLVLETLNPTYDLDFDETTYRIRGSVNSTVYSGPTTLIIALDANLSNASSADIALAESTGTALMVSTSESVLFDRIFNLEDYTHEDSESVRIFVTLCDVKGCESESYDIFIIPDRDGDGFGDDVDEFPDDANEWKDSDNDGVGDNGDAFPSNPGETMDSDNDGVGDNSDVFPLDGTEWLDTDGDGYGDNGDAFPEDPNEHSDADGDGVGDLSDAFPLDGTKWEEEVNEKESSRWESLSNSITEDPMTTTFALSAIILALIALLQTNLIAQFLPESLRMALILKDRRRNTEEDQMWYDQVKSVCQLMKDDVQGLRDWLAEEKITVMGDGIHSSKSDKSVKRRIGFITTLDSLNDKQLSTIWKNQRLFGKSNNNDIVSQIEEDLMFDTDINPESNPSSDTSPIAEHPLSSINSNLASDDGYEWYVSPTGEKYYRTQGSQSDWIKHQ